MLNKPKQQIALITASILLTGFSTATIVTFINPFAASALTISFFYAGLFLTSLGILTLFGLGLRQLFSPKTFIFNFSSSFRQSVLMSLLVTACFLLLANGLFYWWVVLSLILFLLAIEILYNLKI